MNLFSHIEISSALKLEILQSTTQSILYISQ